MSGSKSNSEASRGRSLPPWFWVALAFGLAVLPLVVLGFPRGHDWPHEIVRIAQYRAALAEGQMPPAWAPDAYGGLGSPVFLLYGQLFLFMVSVVYGVGGALFGSLAGAAALSLVLCAALGVVGVALLVRLLAAREGPTTAGRAGRVAAILFVLHPYLLADALVRNANAEFLALCLVPWPLAAVAVADRLPGRTVLGVAVGFGLVVTAHNLTALVAAGLVAGLTVGLYIRGPLRAWLSVGVGSLLGIALSAWFWLPALTLGPWMRRDDLFLGHLDYRRNFLSPLELFDGSVYYSSGPLAALVLGLAAWSWASGRLSRRPRRVVAAALLGIGLCAAAMLPISAPVWERVPWLPLFQFPWRFMGPFGLLVAIAGGLAVAKAAERVPARHRLWIEGAVLLLALGNALPVLQTARPLPERVIAELDEVLEPAAVRAFGHRTTVGDVFAPAGADLSLWRPGQPVPTVLDLPEGATVDVVESSGSAVVVELSTPTAGELVVGRWYYPGWSATVDGRPVAVAASRGGALSLRVAEGRQRVAVRFRGPRSRRIGLAVSGLALLGLVVVPPFWGWMVGGGKAERGSLG